jgi:DNA mismatch repair protein MSH4
MKERPGVINSHLAVDMSEENTMTMLYKVKNDFVKEEHYGLALARVVDLPAEVLEVAETVSRALEAQTEAKKKSSKSCAVAKRRKLVMSLREMLQQAADSPMEGKVLLSWLRKLQAEFVRRMEQIENDVASSDTEESEEDQTEGTVTARSEVA